MSEKFFDEFLKISDYPQIVLTCGISGSGKTYFSQKLEKSGYIRLSSDEIAWQIYGGDFTSLPHEKQQKIFAEAATHIDCELDHLLSSGSRVVVDSTLCKRRRRDALRAICMKHNIVPVLVYLCATYETLHSRLSTRTGIGPNDIIIPDSDLMSFFQGFEVPTSDEHPFCL